MPLLVERCVKNGGVTPEVDYDRPATFVPKSEAEIEAGESREGQALGLRRAELFTSPGSRKQRALEAAARELAAKKAEKKELQEKVAKRRGAKLKAAWPSLFQDPNTGAPKKLSKREAKALLAKGQTDASCFLCSTWWTAWQAAGLLDAMVDEEGNVEEADAAGKFGAGAANLFEWVECGTQAMCGCGAWCCPRCRDLKEVWKLHETPCKARLHPEKAKLAAKKKKEAAAHKAASKDQAEEKERAAAAEARSEAVIPAPVAAAARAGAAPPKTRRRKRS